MIEASDITKRQMIDSLYSRTCPACGDRKGEQKTFCYSCYGSLPARLKSSLYARVGSGYEPAVIQSMQALKADKFHEELPR